MEKDPHLCQECNMEWSIVNNLDGRSVNGEVDRDQLRLMKQVEEDSYMENKDDRMETIVDQDSLHTKQCMNCQRQHYRNDSYYEISFTTCYRNQIIRRKKYRFVRYSASSRDILTLCKECANYLLNNDGAVYTNMWPSFLWYFLSNEEINHHYGETKWKYVPDTLLLGWSYLFDESDNIITDSYFRDITNAKMEFEECIKSPYLSTVAESCNKYLIPTILCPWGCSEYLHKGGKLYIDLVVQRFCTKVRLILINNVEDCSKLFSARDDYIRDQTEYDCILMNPQWQVCPKWYYLDGKGPCILTCRDHDNGTKKKYVHLPRNPFEHNLPSRIGDQLCHVVLKPRVIKPMRAGSYSNTYQMHEQKGCIHGIDTCSLTNFGDFSEHDNIIDQYEATSICNRADINSLLTKLEEEKRLCLTKGEEMKKHTLWLTKGINFEKYIEGSTYITIDDALLLQENFNKVNMIKVRSQGNNIVHCKRNWNQHIIYSQKLDKNKYGAQFPIIPYLRKNNIKTENLWTLLSMMIYVKEMWQVIDEKEKNVKEWDGWFLTFVSKECFKEYNVKSDRLCPFRYSYIDSLTKFLNKMESLNINFEDEYILNTLLLGIEMVSVYMFNIHYNSDEIDLSNNVIVILNNRQEVDDSNVEEIESEYLIEDFISDDDYELRYIGCSMNLIGTDNSSPNNWDFKCYFRHGNTQSSWWQVCRSSKLPIHCDRLQEKFLICNLKVMVYVRKYKKEINEIRNSMLKYIGGQTNIICGVHCLPLIVVKGNTDNRCSGCQCCSNEVFYGCPDIQCDVYLCKNKFTQMATCNKDIKYVYPKQQNFSMDEMTLDELISVDTSDSSVSDFSVSSKGTFGEDDTCFDKYMFYNDGIDYSDEYLEEDVNDKNIIHSTNSGETAYVVSQEVGEKIDGHVILNQCGSILCRSDININSVRAQRHFLQRMASTINEQCVPLLYAEAMMFPSIFWKLHNQSGSFPGSLPSSFLASKVPSCGFASIKNHINIRITNQCCSSSTNPSYISFLYDILSNLLLNSVDSRLIISRGLTCEDGNIGIRVKSSKDTNLHDSIDSKQMVKNLCASQKYIPMHFFLTFTVNQSEHFGIKHIKRWIDNLEWVSQFKDYVNLTPTGKQNIKKSMDLAGAPILLRNWMETRTLLINYIYSSPKSPYAPVNAIFSRDEYQKDKGNLPHIHMILSVKMKNLSREQRERLDNLIRASICEIRSYDEIQELINEGVINSWDEINEIHDIARKVLSHKCDRRCLRRVGDGDGPENFKCRKIDNSKISPDNTKNSYISIESKRNKQCIDQLIKIGMAEPIKYNEYGVPSTFKAYHPYFHPKRHIPPINPNDNSNISPVEGYTFSILKSMQNVQSLAHTNGLIRYVCKYIASIDENNYISIKSNSRQSGSLIAKKTFLHNTKISTSAIHEKKALNYKRDKFHPKGREVCVTEMLQIMLSYPQVRTDMKYEIIATVPMEQRTGVEKKAKVYTRMNIVEENGLDGISTSFPASKVRLKKNLPEWRQLKDTELITLEGALSSRVSVDKVTGFSLRPPELREIVTQVGNFYRWFYIGNTAIHDTKLEELIDADIYNSCWINSLQQHVYIRQNALSELMCYLGKKDVVEYTDSFVIMYNWIKEIYRLSTAMDLNNDEKQILEFITKNIIYDDELKHLIIPVFSYIKPTMGTRFILHILLSLGHFETELDLMLKPTIRESLRYAKLIGTSNEKEDLIEYSKKLQKMFIEEQLVYFPNGSNIISAWIVYIGELFDSIIIRNEIPIQDMPPVLQTKLEHVQNEKAAKDIELAQISMIKAAYQELQHIIEFTNLPDVDQYIDQYKNECLSWNPLEDMRKTPYQNDDSYLEQKEALTMGIRTINQYMSGIQQSTFVKCIMISGSPGTGKTFLEICLILYAISKNLCCGITAVMAKRAVQLGGKHIHKLFCLPGHNKYSLYRLAEVALISLTRNAERYFF